MPYLKKDVINRNPMNKYYTLEALQQKCEQDKQHGKSLVFTNGCFDILHVGHIRYLQKARTYGDRLIVALNSDASVRRLKGAFRPIVSENDRCEVIAALACVDYVMLFNDDTPYQVIATLIPDILIKGGDYEPDDVVGKDILEAHGGRVIIEAFEAGKSTTGILDKIYHLHAKETP